MIAFDKLLPGDLIFVRRGAYDYIHCGLCTKSEGTFESVLMAHTLGKAQPYALVETNLAPKEILIKNDLHYDIVRPLLIDINVVLKIISEWLKNLIPYDQNKYLKLVLMTDNVDVIGSEGSLNKYSHAQRVEAIEREIEKQRELYQDNKFSLISLAATRNIGPTIPFPITDKREAEGIICTSHLIMSMQIACIINVVHPAEDYWVSDADVNPDELNDLLDLKKPVHMEYFAYIEHCKNHNATKRFPSSLRLLKKPLEEIDLDGLPLGIKLSHNLCPVSILYFSLLKDTLNFKNMGELESVDCINAQMFKMKFEKEIPSLVTQANHLRQLLYKKLNF